LSAATIDRRVVAFSIATVSLWGLLLSLAPLAETFRVQLATTLARDGRRSSAGVSSSLRSALIVGQIALSVVLLVGAALLVRTFVNVQQVDPGFRSDGILSFRIALPGQRYGSVEAFNTFARRLQTELAALPGVSGAAGISHAPYDHVPNWGGPYTATEGADPSTAQQADYRAVAPGAMELLDVRLLDGRWFTESDDPGSAPVVIVDERLARRTWPGASAVGRRLGVDPSVAGTPTTWTTVVGVVKHVRHRSPVEDVRDQVYFPARQVTRNPSVYLIKTSGDPAALVPAVRDALKALDPALPIYDVRPLMAYVEDARALRRFTSILAALFAVAAVALAAVGIYGVIAYGVTARRREFGVRVALGAGAPDVMRLVVGESVKMTAQGLGVGLLGAAAGAWWLRAQLVGIAPWDPVALLVTVVVLAGVSLVASAAPALRAIHTDPAAVLREG
jgi:predicted permease